MMKVKKTATVLERFLFSNPGWQAGYRSFNHLFGRPLGWLFLFDKVEGNRLIRLDRKDTCSFYAASRANQISMETFLNKYCELLAAQPDQIEKLPGFYKDAFGKQGIIFPLIHLGKLKGFLVLSSLHEASKRVAPFIQAFYQFLIGQAELAYKNFELNNFYETVHPRALALSTMHSVHRVISSSIRLKDLLPRIGRLSAQVLKAQGCAIMLMDPSHDFLIPAFAFGVNRKFIHKQRIRVGRGLQGRIAETGEFHISRRSISVPFIEEDIVGVIALWDKVDHQAFTKMDLEILKSLSEQAVVAIKNAQLFEETEQLTLGSIKTINELLKLKGGEDRAQLSLLGDIVMQVGRELQLSGRDMIHIQRAILLRDAGMLAFPGEIWKKKGKLTKKEFEMIKKVPLRGASLLSSISSLKPVLPIVLHHRERFNGKGYPDGLKGEEIPIGARIVAVVDSFVAMLSERAYRERMTIEQALKEIQANSGTQFDPKVVDCFLKVVRFRETYEKLKQASSITGKSQFSAHAAVV